MPNATYSTPQNFKQPVLRYHGNNEFLLVEDYIFTWTTNGIQKKLHIPAGQDYDKASVPRFAWALFRPDGEVEAAALIHDMLYKYKGQLKPGWYQTFTKGEWKEGSTWSRKEADEMLEWMAILGGMSKPQAAIYKLAVRLYPPNWFKGF